VAGEEVLDRPHVLGVEHGLEVHHAEIAAALEVAGLVEHVGEAAGHAGREVPARLADDDHAPAVMYSQPWSPAPSTTAKAPLLRTAKRSPATPRK